jgi:hypothetical protein
MPILEKFTKQPVEVQDYDLHFTDWLAALGDTAPGPAGAVAVADAGITLDYFTLTDGVVKVWLSGGADGIEYKVTVTLTTTGGRVKQDEISVKVKET